MKLIWVGIGLLVATISVGVGCGPKEKYCYNEQELCSQVAGQMAADAAWEATPDADATTANCFNTAGDPVPCG